MRPKKVVLLVDADDDRISLRRFQLTTWGYDVVSARTVMSARDEMQNGRIDLVVSDLDLAGGSGLLLAEHLQRERPEISVLLISDSVQGVDHKADLFLGKNYFTFEALRENVKSMAAGRRGPKKAVVSELQEVAG